ncbi:collagen alpha-1(III) chain-like [Meriones unguiculatus]|uniref:collagen alpha-1(III) chain-like n=1 Tax=Meriones unguiculatus TaxID=10047 RepID=UPI00293EA7D4|nr:collagen alpha-1(III) chain-like [Meriones unguiculatus]
MRRRRPGGARERAKRESPATTHAGESQPRPPHSRTDPDTTGKRNHDHLSSFFFFPRGIGRAGRPTPGAERGFVRAGEGRERRGGGAAGDGHPRERRIRHHRRHHGGRRRGTVTGDGGGGTGKATPVGAPRETRRSPPRDGHAPGRDTPRLFGHGKKPRRRERRGSVGGTGPRRAPTRNGSETGSGRERPPQRGAAGDLAAAEPRREPEERGGPVKTPTASRERREARRARSANGLNPRGGGVNRRGEGRRDHHGRGGPPRPRGEEETSTGAPAATGRRGRKSPQTHLGRRTHQRRVNCSRKPLLPSRGAGRTRETSPGATQRPHAERGRSRGAGTALQLLHPHTPSGLSRTAPNARGATARARGDPPPEGGTGPGQHGRGGRPGHEGAGSGGRGGGTTRQGRDAGDGGGDDGNGPPHPSTHRERGRPRPGGDRPNTGGRKRTGITPLTLRERSRHTRGAEPSRPQKRRRPPPTGSPGETQRERLPNADATAAEGPSSGNGTPPTSDDEPDAADRRLQKAAPEREIDTPPRPGRPRIPRRGERSPALPQPWERCRGGGASGTTPRHTNRPQRTHHARQRPSRGNGKDGDAHGRAARGGRPRGGGRGTGTGGTGSPPPPFRYPSRGAPRGWDGADRARAGVHTRPFHHRYRQPPPREPNTPRRRHDAELLPRVIPPRTRSEEARAALEKERFLTEGGAYPTRPSTPGRGQPEKRRACGRDAHTTRPPSSNGGEDTHAGGLRYGPPPGTRRGHTARNDAVDAHPTRGPPSRKRAPQGASHRPLGHYTRPPLLLLLYRVSRTSGAGTDPQEGRQTTGTSHARRKQAKPSTGGARGNGKRHRRSEAGTSKSWDAPGAPRGSQRTRRAHTDRERHATPQMSHPPPARGRGLKGPHGQNEPTRSPTHCSNECAGTGLRPGNRTLAFHTPPRAGGEERRRARWQNERSGRHSQ